MSVTPERLEEKRRRAETLRQEISTLQYAAQEDSNAASLAQQDAALDEEIARLERQKEFHVELAQRADELSPTPGGGSVAEALAAMAAAQEQVESATAMAPSSRPSLGDKTTPEGEGK